jgi:CO/xanthine dehydrogenase Mo-binding subunit
MEAAERARAILASATAEKLAVPADRLVFAEGRVFDAADPDRSMSFTDAVWAAETVHGLVATTGSYVPPRSPGRYRGAGVGPSPTYSYTAAVLEIAVDPATGLIDVLQVWIAHDIGKAINPVLTLGQVEGSVYMGLGEALLEEQVVRRLPRHRSGASVLRAVSMLDYKSPTFLDMPPVTTYLIEDPDPAGPFGAKEVGQGPLLPIAPALANAVYDAVGVRIDEVPILPHKILAALDAAKRGETARSEPRTARFGPMRFPEVDYGETLIVPTPAEGGDGTAINDWKDRQRRGMRGPGGTMAERP